jgi:hypothetical protein
MLEGYDRREATMAGSRAVRTLGTAGLIGAMGGWALTSWGALWGSTTEEQALALPGDDYVAGGPPTHAAMTRAVTVAAPPEKVWPWVAQLGRGAGFYSYDALDNGSRPSARHIVSWIPEPAVGDATAMGYLRHVEPGVGLTWWLPGVRFLGAWTRMAFDIHLARSGPDTRVVTRVTGDAAGVLARPVIGVFRPMDSIMAVRQLVGLRERVEEAAGATAAGSTSPPDPETGARDQYQLYEVVYASGERAGVAGQELAARWRRAAVTDGVLTEPMPA